MMKRLLPLAVLLVLLPGCVRAISDQSRGLVTPGLSFAAIKAEPMASVGKYALVGGRIAAVRNTNEGGELEIVQFELDDDGFPVDNGQSGGRFLAISLEFLDRLVYQPGRPVTLVGEVKGKKSMPLDDLDYSYPVVAIREVHLWKMPERDQQLFTQPLYNDPYYYDYTQSPYWYRQFVPGPMPPTRR